MNRTSVMNHQRVYTMPFSRVYPLLVTKAVKKGRTLSEVNQVITWLTGYTIDQLTQQIDQQVSYETFFREAPWLNPLRVFITGVICGIRIEAIEDPLMKEIRYLDKLVDELAKGYSMEKILRKGMSNYDPSKSIDG